MKTSLLLLLAGSLCAFAGNATVYTVDNNVPSGGQYTTLNAAQAAASAGDTLYVSGSPYSYGNFTFTKSLVIIGTGHNPQNDNKQVSILGNIDFNSAGSGFGSKVIGISFDNYTAAGYMTNWSIMRCRIGTTLNMSSPNPASVNVEGNVFAGAVNNIYCNSGYEWNDVTFQNNVFNGYSYLGIGSSSLNVLFLNNLFLRAGDAFSGGNYLNFQNNIYYRANPSGSVSSSTFIKNVIDAANTYTFSGSNNVYTNNFQADPQFVNFPAAGADFDYSHDYHLQTTPTPSTLINAGVNGTDIGLTGGSGYFDINGIPPIPQIRKFDIVTPANGIVSPGGSITIDLRSTIKQ